MSLAQAFGADIKALRSKPSSTTVTYSSGSVTQVSELVDGVSVVTNITYNSDGTVNTITYPRNGKMRTETYAYSSGSITGMTSTEV